MLCVVLDIYFNINNDREEKSEDYAKEVQDQINLFFESLELSSTGYIVSFCRDELNKSITDINFDNRQIKNLVINYFGEGICFTYPNDRKKLQMFFSMNVRVGEIAESLGSKTDDDVIIACAKILREECNSYKFDIDNSYCDGNDVNISLINIHRDDRPKSSETFFKSLMKVRSPSEDLTRKCDTLFQQIFYLINNGRKKAPLRVSLAQSIHDKCRSKNLIQILNNRRMSENYDEMLRMDYNLVERLIRCCGENNVLSPKSITSTSIIHASTDNFDHIENSKSGKDSSHDTIMMLFQNNKIKEEKISELSYKLNDQIK